jgi:hypothetical protein
MVASWRWAEIRNVYTIKVASQHFLGCIKLHALMHGQKNIHVDCWKSKYNFLFKCDLSTLQKKETEIN